MPTKIYTQRETGRWTPEPWDKEERREALKAIIQPTLVMWGFALVLCSIVFYFVSWWLNGSPVPLW